MTPIHPRPGLLFVLVAPAGAGKNSLMNIVLAETHDLRQLPTATTRPIRPGEAQGREHLFVSHEQFQHMIDNDALLEWQVVHGQLYGVPRATVEDALDSADDLIADIDFKGATVLRENYPDNTIIIFIHPPSVDALIDRMRTRGETEAEIGRRLLRVPAELEYAAKSDYIIYNDELDEAADFLRGIIVVEKNRHMVRRLRAQRAESGSGLSFSCMSLVVHNDTVLVTDASVPFPAVTRRPDEPPVESVVRLLEQQLKLPVEPEHFVTLHESQDGFVPPVYVEHTHVDDRDTIRLYYLYRLSKSVAPPPGWRWLPIAEADLPEPVLALLTAPVSDPAADGS